MRFISFAGCQFIRRATQNSLIAPIKNNYMHVYFAFAHYLREMLRAAAASSLEFSKLHIISAAINYASISNVVQTMVSMLCSPIKSALLLFPSLANEQRTFISPKRVAVLFKSVISGGFEPEVRYLRCELVDFL